MIRLGVIGLSPGNGHPYSWSAIFNGYDPDEMEHCGFPVIPRYLKKQVFPRDQIAGAKVTHVWAQDREVASHIARASLIENVVDRYEDMVGQVDAILLARDDAERHAEFALTFIEAGLPVYIDKPLALSVAEARVMLAAQKYTGQLFTCSALRYASEFCLSGEDRAVLGPIRQIYAMTPKDWDKYAVHVIEPSLLQVKDRGAVIQTEVLHTGDSTTLAATFSSGLQLHVTALGRANGPLSLKLIGENGWKEMFFQDAFLAFKSALEDFITGVTKREERIAPEFVLEVVGLIEAGRKL
ncbi:MAG: hypothetical protein FHK82_05090 [Sedimenticola thiotaurini]|uniref:Gfo/Idh/MocA-like oxidoreductase N-terminal domain-containing protein n=1 Tax=Sedimenticola thiotaurini TaxID=1543721 RepID=A0A558DAQ0_9GAMM|nr:MAG: hypothetical protein FHK82_05090 [Sedimenticola thiotaurini]